MDKPIPISKSRVSFAVAAAARGSPRAYTTLAHVLPLWSSAHHHHHHHHTNTNTNNQPRTHKPHYTLQQRAAATTPPTSPPPPATQPSPAHICKSFLSAPYWPGAPVIADHYHCVKPCTPKTLNLEELLGVLPSSARHDLRRLNNQRPTSSTRNRCRLRNQIQRSMRDRQQQLSDHS